MNEITIAVLMSGNCFAYELWRRFMTALSRRKPPNSCAKQ